MRNNMNISKCISILLIYVSVYTRAYTWGDFKSSWLQDRLSCSYSVPASLHRGRCHQTCVFFSLLYVNCTRCAWRELIIVIFKEDWKTFLSGYLCSSYLINCINISGCFFNRFQIWKSLVNHVSAGILGWL